MIFYQSDEFKDASVNYGFFGRKGGVSGGDYFSLNCGQGSGDQAESIAENRAIVAREMGAAPQSLLSLYQIHSAVCVRVDAPWQCDDKPKADAMVTDKAGIALGVLSADCTPVLFMGAKDDGAPVIGAAHAGWRGAFGGALEATVQGMIDLGAAAGSLQACIGPCIRQASYEVDGAFYQNFLNVDAGHAHFFIAGEKAGHYMFDLAGYCAARLKAAGVARVFDLGLDTYARTDDFFSYRRMTHRGEADYGRQISAIVIES